MLATEEALTVLEPLGGDVTLLEDTMREGMGMYWSFEWTLVLLLWASDTEASIMLVVSCIPASVSLSFSLSLSLAT